MEGEKECKIVLYHANWCGHCKNWVAFKDKFNVFKDSTGRTVNIKYGQYDDNHEETKKNGINGYPTIHIVIDDKKIDYNGDRSIEDIMKNVIDAYEDNGIEYSNNGLSDNISISEIDLEEIMSGGFNKKMNNKNKNKNINSLNEISDYKKYLKYKSKYLKLKRNINI